MPCPTTSTITSPCCSPSKLACPLVCVEKLVMMKTICNPKEHMMNMKNTKTNRSKKSKQTSKQTLNKFKNTASKHKKQIFVFHIILNILVMMLPYTWLLVKKAPTIGTNIFVWWNCCGGTIALAFSSHHHMVVISKVVWCSVV